MHVLGLELRSFGVVDTVYGPRALWQTANAPPDVAARYEAIIASSVGRDILQRLPLSRPRWGHELSIWRAPAAPAPGQSEIDAIIAEAEATVAQEIADAPAKAARRVAQEAEERAARERADEERREAYRLEQEAEEARRAEAVRRQQAAITDLRELDNRRPWAIHHSHVEKVAHLLALKTPSAWDLKDALRIVDAALANLERARGRVDAYVPTAADLALAQDDQVRRLIAHGVEYVTLQDSDRAVQSNGVGWSKSASASGHTLAALAVENGGLTESQAAHGLSLLRRHAGQLPTLIQLSLFERAVRPSTDAGRRARERADLWYADRVGEMRASTVSDGLAAAAA